LLRLRNVAHDAELWNGRLSLGEGMAMSDSKLNGAPASRPADDRGSRRLFLLGTDPISLAGLLLIYMSIAIFVVICFLVVEYPRRQGLYDVIPEMLLFVIGCFSAFLGVSLVRTAGLAITEPNVVINPKEWAVISEEVKQGKEDAITQYIRLTSLTGVSGFFTKLGLSGLPLATIGLTIFFSLLLLEAKEYLDLAKLTLGAFIGSFVQKQIGTGGGTVQLPTGEKLKVSSSGPPPTI
jgi:hypothetical protein